MQTAVVWVVKCALGTGFLAWHAVAWRAAVAVLACPDVPLEAFFGDLVFGG